MRETQKLYFSLAYKILFRVLIFPEALHRISRGCSSAKRKDRCIVRETFPVHIERAPSLFWFPLRK